MKEITAEQAFDMLYNRAILKLLVTDYQRGMALDEEQNGFFTAPTEIQAALIADFIERRTKKGLTETIKEIIEEDK